MKSAHLREIEPVRIQGKLLWHPVRKRLGISAFGINAYTADTGQEVIEAHNETGPGAGHHEEVYVVVAGRATFTVNGADHDAPAGAILFLDDPTEHRRAVALEDGTTVLAVGGPSDAAFQPSPWEYVFSAIPAIESEQWEEAKIRLLEGLQQYPGNASLLYDLACVEAQAGSRGDAIDHLAAAIEAWPKFRADAAKDQDFASLHNDARFAGIVGADR
jgi:quercetin dioxygenase-like cupin family protein